MMAIWKEQIDLDVETPVAISPEGIIYEVHDTVVVRTVQQRDLLARRERLVKTIAEIDADLVKIGELQAAELVAKGVE